MAIDKRLQIYDEQGNLVDYDILASDVKFLPDGKDLPTKLAEMQDDIDAAGSGDGTVTGVKVNGTTHEPNDQGVVDIGTVITQHQDISGLATKTEVSTGLATKVDKNGTDSLMTAAEHTKLGNLPTATELATQMNAKANDNAVVKTISVNGGQAQTPQNGNVNISVQGGGSVDSITVGDHTYTPDVNGDVDLGDLRGQDGNSGVASADGVESVNNLNGGTTDTSSKVYVLGANQGKRLRDQIDLIYQRVQSLYSLLGNIAFWEGKPAASALLPDLDWSNPKHNVTLALSLTNAVVKHNGVSKSNGDTIQVEEGGTLTLTVEPANECALTGAPTVSTGATVTANGNGTYSVAITMGQSNLTLSITATGATSHTVTANLTDCTLDVVGQVTGSYSGQLTAKSHSTMVDAYVTVKMGGTDITSTAYNASTGEIEIDDVTDDIEVNATAVAVKPEKWLVSAGNSYCDLGFLPTATMSYRLLYKFTDISQYGRNVAATTEFALPKARTQGGSNWYSVFGRGNELIVPATINTGTEYEFILFRDGDKVMCNGEVIGQLQQRSGVQTSPYAFVHSAALTDASAKLKGSILYIEVFDLVDGVDTLLHRFVPDTQNGANGFLDTVTNTFLPSTSGTAFTIENRLQ